MEVKHDILLTFINFLCPNFKQLHFRQPWLHCTCYFHKPFHSTACCGCFCFQLFEVHVERSAWGCDNFVLQEFKCEICGNYSYWGRRAFERHFKEWRHQHGMRCLGIPNTKNFNEITSIEVGLCCYFDLPILWVYMFLLYKKPYFLLLD